MSSGLGRLFYFKLRSLLYKQLTQVFHYFCLVYAQAVNNKSVSRNTSTWSRMYDDWMFIISNLMIYMYSFTFHMKIILNINEIEDLDKEDKSLPTFRLPKARRS